jgi:AcrR family transcriptional regulator
VSIATVARLAGIKAPSLYKHFADRAALLTAVEEAVLRQLEARLRQIGVGAPRERVFAMAHAYRTFGREAPLRYGMIYRRDAAAETLLGQVYRLAAQPLFEAIEAAGVPPQRLLGIARTLVPFLHGFVCMEIAQAFRFGGSLDDDFAAALEIILAEV